MRLEVVFAAHAARRPDKEALVCGERRVSYRDLQRRIREVAGGLARQGIGAGDTLVLYLPNGIAFVELLYAAFLLGAVVVPVTTRSTAREVTYFCEDSAAKLIVCDDRSADAVRGILVERGGLKAVMVGASQDGFVAYDDLIDATFVPSFVPLDRDVALILYTSGTTGRPKGVLLTHANILVNHGFMNGTDWGINHDDRFLVVSPLAHRAGLGRLMNAMTLGGTLVMLPGFDADKIIDTIEREAITVFGMVPTICRMLLPALERAPDRCRTLRLAPVTGEAFAVELKQRFMALLPDTRLVSFFGMTEAGAISNLAHEEQVSHPRSVGRAAPGVEVRIVAQDGRDVADGTVGEIVVRSGQPGVFTVMKGYLNRSEETARALMDGWFFTGDLGYRDNDGYLYIVDRKKDMILSGGFNVYSKEVEQTILEIEGVADAAVVGIPDAEFGEAVVAFVERKQGGPLTAEQVVAHCRSAIASYKKPRHVHFVDALPRNAVGKVLKHQLAERARALHAVTGATGPQG
ncbi:MAG: AMP-dependent synthetase [Proteobacteria bacterium]|nr:MAG: AMP-dependent synthetase [Pseudomonadota bacterium]